MAEEKKEEVKKEEKKLSRKQWNIITAHMMKQKK